MMSLAVSDVTEIAALPELSMPCGTGSWDTVAAVTVLIQAAKVIRAVTELKSELPLLSLLAQRRILIFVVMALTLS
jgi:hypothetical protein